MQSDAFAVFPLKGGWAVIMCPCGIVYLVKFIIRAESPRDYAYMLLSWKHFPNVVVYDFARGLVNHCNVRDPVRLPFSPNRGRLAEASPEKISTAAKEQLKIHLPCLNIKKENPDTMVCHGMSRALCSVWYTPPVQHKGWEGCDEEDWPASRTAWLAKFSEGRAVLEIRKNNNSWTQSLQPVMCSWWDAIFITIMWELIRKHWQMWRKSLAGRWSPLILV